jgi:predicted methyltransferase
MPFKQIFAAMLATAALGLGSCQTAHTALTSDADAAALRLAIEGPARKADNRARDPYRHPYETLAYFGVKPSHTVVEIWPGGGWYSEILAPYVAQGGGRYIAAASDRGLNGVRALATANSAVFGAVETANFPVLDAGGTPVTPGSADVVLTFRNVHNWMMGEKPFADAAFRQMYEMLKPGGTLGVVEHRLPESRSDADQLKSGYVKVSTVRRLAEQAGFRLVGSSEINANPRDTADYPDGVWTLPPTYRLKEKDRERYAAIGESDRMTLRFVKPR